MTPPVRSRPADTAGALQDVLEPAAPNERVARVFAWYCRRLFRKRFHALRATPETVATFASLDRASEPAVVCLNHSAWWDPLVGYLLAVDRTPSRTPFSPMELEQWRQFGFFKKLGLFGLDPSKPESLEALAEHCAHLFERSAAANAPGTLWITPQGRFADVREPAKLRPGAAAVCARLDEPGAQRVRVISLAIEYVFWTDQRAELLLHACSMNEPPERPSSTARWLRAHTRHLRSVQAELAALAIARDESAFVPAFDWAGGEDRARVNPVYDLLLRLRGKSGRVTQRERSGEGPTRETPA
ncbi:MAG: lysophospholipid acyltransferase family protein [Planctomycetota bacterium]